MVDVAFKPGSGKGRLPIKARSASFSQEPELVAELAEAIANRLNNVMMAITSFAELEIKKAGSGSRRDFSQLLNHAADATFLIQKLLAISRKHIPAPQLISPNRVITDLRDLLQYLVGDSIEVVLDLNANIQQVKADSVELERLLLLVALHSRNDMPQGGRLSISTASAHVGEEFARQHKAEPGEYLTISISDTGRHSPSKDAAETGERSNPEHRVSLILDAVRGVVTGANGITRISREPEKGTTLTMYLPAIGGGVEENQETTTAAGAATGRTILVVDDDDAVRIPAAEFLMMQGFKVLQARTGAEALQVVERSRSQLELVITDIVMPKMSGGELAEKLLEVYPELKVLYMSGDSGVAANGGQAGQHILQKPFRLTKLSAEIRELLGQ